MQPQETLARYLSGNFATNTASSPSLVYDDQPARFLHALHDAVHVPRKDGSEVNELNLGPAEGLGNVSFELRWRVCKHVHGGFAVVYWSAPCQEGQVVPGRECLGTPEGQMIIVDGYLLHYGTG